jgi:hypothetical protein
MAIRARYIGPTEPHGVAVEDGGTGIVQRPTAFLDGFPARDLSDEEFDALSARDQERLQECGLYRLVTTRAAKAATADDEPAPRRTAEAKSAEAKPAAEPDEAAGERPAPAKGD